MKIVAITLLSLFLNWSASAHCNKAYHLSLKERNILIKKANAGDGNAAYRMYNYHSMSSRNETESSKWLNRSAELGHAEAQRWLAYMIIEYKRGHKAFGTTPQAAVLSLLTEASKTNGTAANELGERYYQGFFGDGNKHEQARKSLLLAASHHHSSSWKLLAYMLHKGEGGKEDQAKAYYYICLSTQCTHPASFGGKKLWKLRLTIEEKLTLVQKVEVWKNVDAYIAKERKRSDGRIYPPPLLGSAIPLKKWNESLKATNEFEDIHRKRLQINKKLTNRW